jgi:hypothetical protein
MKHLSESKILQKFNRPPGGPPPDPPKPPGSISVFPTSPLDLPSETFGNALKRRENNHRNLFQWIKNNLQPDIDYGRTHIEENCKYARAGVPQQCRDFSHMSMITLWKSGSEKILNTLALSVRFPTLHHYELACVHKQEIAMVVLKCELRTQNGAVVAEGCGARHIRQDDWNVHKAIKMSMKSAVIDATIRVAGLTGIFIKTHQHTVKNKFPGMSDCNHNNVPPGGLCNGLPEDKLITLKQKDLIHKIADRKGMTTESLQQLIQDQFNKGLDNLTRVEASKFIQQSF